MSFLIFLPSTGTDGPDVRRFHDVGLGDLLRPDDQQPGALEIADRTPTGTPGQLWGWLTDGPQTLAYQPETQVWQAARPHGKLPAGRYWIGWEMKSPPTPADLRRSVTIPGYPQTLGDGREWLVPNAAEVPQRYDLDEAGAWKTVALERYQAFVERSVWAFDFCRRMIEAGYTLSYPPEAVDYAIESLNWNYRLPRELAAALGILQPANLFQIIASTTELDRLRGIGDELKKTD